jgi:hypothetical protein
MTESSSIPATVDFTAWKGDTFRRALTVTDESDVAWNFSGASVKLYLRESPEASPVLTLQSGSGVSIASNVVTIEITSAQTDALKIRSYLYEIEYTGSGGDVRTWIAGKLLLKGRAE